MNKSTTICIFHVKIGYIATVNARQKLEHEELFGGFILFEISLKIFLNL
jgi:hypothetical protein